MNKNKVTKDCLTMKIISNKETFKNLMKLSHLQIEINLKFICERSLGFDMIIMIRLDALSITQVIYCDFGESVLFNKDVLFCCF